MSATWPSPASSTELMMPGSAQGRSGRRKPPPPWPTCLRFAARIPRRKYEIYNVEHLLAHIASAYYLSPFDTVVGLSYDGSSDFASPMTERCEDLKNDILDRVSLPNSLGHDYTAMCQFIGFDLFGEEDKVMGLAPYGEDLYAAQMAWIVQPDAA